MSLMAKKDLPIGIFDSGVGGLTVLRALQQALPLERFMYLGDTARLPYGTKSPETVKNYTVNASHVLIEQQIKMLVVACNTASAVSIETLQEIYTDIPVIGVIHPGAQAALAVPQSGPIVVLATEGTVKGHAYRRMLHTLAPGREVIEWPCPLLVALAEEGWCEGELVEQIIAKTLSELLPTFSQIQPACVLLGCTHYPVLKSAIEKVVGKNIPVIDPAQTLASHVHAILYKQNLLCTDQTINAGRTRFMATDGNERFARVAQIFLKSAIHPEEVELVTVLPVQMHMQSHGHLPLSENYIP